MSRHYGFWGARGFTPGKQMQTTWHRKLRTLVDRVEGGLERPFGAALDLGYGWGRWSLELAERGWVVTDIDVIPKAVLDVRRRADDAGVASRLAEGSVTALRDAGVGTGYRLVLDIERDPSP